MRLIGVGVLGYVRLAHGRTAACIILQINPLLHLFLYSLSGAAVEEVEQACDDENGCSQSECPRTMSKSVIIRDSCVVVLTDDVGCSTS